MFADVATGRDADLSLRVDEAPLVVALGDQKAGQPIVIEGLDAPVPLRLQYPLAPRVDQAVVVVVERGRRDRMIAKGVGVAEGGLDDPPSFTVDETDAPPAPFDRPVAFSRPGQALAPHLGQLVVFLAAGKGAALVNEAPALAGQLDRRHTVPERTGLLIAGFDQDMSIHADVTPQAVLTEARHPVGRGIACVVVLRRHAPLALGVDETPSAVQRLGCTVEHPVHRFGVEAAHFEKTVRRSQVAALRVDQQASPRLACGQTDVQLAWHGVGRLGWQDVHGGLVSTRSPRSYSHCLSMASMFSLNSPLGGIRKLLGSAPATGLPWWITWPLLIR